MSNRMEIAGLNWAGERTLPAFQAPQQLTIYDIRGASPAVQLSASTAAGLINRPQPRVYLITSDEDQFWLNTQLGSIPKETSPSNGEGVLDGMLIPFRDAIQGMIIYDPNVPDTINVATTLAGQLNGIVVNLAQAQDLQQAYGLRTLRDLRSFQWSNGTQAYTWAIQNLLPASASRVVAGLNSNISTGIRSFLVATGAFVYWLDSRHIWPNIPTSLQSDRDMMEQIFKAYPPGAAHMGWFIDEGSGVTLTSNAALPVVASDFFTNMEVWTAIQPNTPIHRQPQQPPTTPAVAPNKVYISFTVSDGDNLQYVQHKMLRNWRDPGHDGSFPLGWTISPLLLQAAPSMLSYYYQTAKPNDEFVAAPSGAGYMFPSRWPAQQLPPFLQQTGQLMQELGLTTLEVLDVDFLMSTGIPIIANLRQSGMVFEDTKLQQSFVQALVPHGVHAILSGSGVKAPFKSIEDNVPIIQNVGLADSVSKTLDLVHNAVTTSKPPFFLSVYIMAWTMTPTNIKQVIEQLGSQYEVVSPGTLARMVAQAK